MPAPSWFIPGGIAVSNRNQTQSETRVVHMNRDVRVDGSDRCAAVCPP